MRVEAPAGGGGRARGAFRAGGGGGGGLPGVEGGGGGAGGGGGGAEPRGPRRPPRHRRGSGQDVPAGEASDRGWGQRVEVEHGEHGPSDGDADDVSDEGVGRLRRLLAWALEEQHRGGSQAGKQPGLFDGQAYRPAEGEHGEGQDGRIQSGAELPGPGLQAVEERGITGRR